MIALTANEVAALTGLDERVVRKDVEQGVVEVSSPPRFAQAALVYFSAVAEFALHLATRERRRLYQLISRALDEGQSRLELGPGWTLDVESLQSQLMHRYSAFEEWKRTLVTDERILGGETVFPSSRLSVRRVGRMLQRGVPASELLEDYPFLTESDLQFARLYATAHPRIGRPRAQAAPR